MKYLLLALLPLTASASLDLSCMNQCTAKHAYQFCEKQCVYGEVGNDERRMVPRELPRVDLNCLNECTPRHAQQYCVERCSY